MWGSICWVFLLFFPPFPVVLSPPFVYWGLKARAFLSVLSGWSVFLSGLSLYLLCCVVLCFHFPSNSFPFPTNLIHLSLISVPWPCLFPALFVGFGLLPSLCKVPPLCGFQRCSGSHLCVEFCLLEKRSSAALQAPGRRSSDTCSFSCISQFLVTSLPTPKDRGAVSQVAAERWLGLLPVSNCLGSVCCHIRWALWRWLCCAVLAVGYIWCREPGAPGEKGRAFLWSRQSPSCKQSEKGKFSKWNKAFVHMSTGTTRSVSLIQSPCTSKCLISAAKHKVFWLFKQNVALFSFICKINK